MHAAFPRLIPEIQHVIQLGFNESQIPQIMEQASGKVLANSMAVILTIGFAYVMRNSLLDKEQAKKALTFFNENFTFTDPTSTNGHSYYQGKFLIRTRKAGDDMNVWFRFCPNPNKIFVESPFGRTLDPFAIVTAQAINESEAKDIENDPDKVDLVINFKDVGSILALIGRTDVDMVGLLLENVVQLTGNMGHLFKLGAIAKNIESVIELPKVTEH